MQSSSRAPLLSATLSTDSCWIMSARLLQNFGDTPARLLGDRASLDDAHAIADSAHALLVVNLEAPGMTDDLLVERVGLEDLHQHDHGLLHLVAHDNAVTNLAPRTRCLLDRVTHRHPPRRRRARRAPPRAPSARQREQLRERRPGRRGVRRVWPAAYGEAWASLPPAGPRAARGPPASAHARSRSSRSSLGRSR